MNVNMLLKHVEDECTGEQLKCPSCKLNIFRMYKDNDNRSEGHLCIRDLTLETEDLQKQLSTKEQSNQALENKIKQL